jgi:hypothetical protein
MTKIDGGRVGPVGPDPVLYEDVQALEHLKSALDPKAAPSEAREPSRALRDLLFARPADAGGLVSTPPLPEGMAARPTGRECVALLKRAAERDPRSGEPAETRLRSTLKGLLDAQDGILARLAKLTKA